MIVSILLPIFRHVFECINLILTMFFFFDFFVAPTTICVSVLINAFFYFDGIKKNPITLALNCYCCSSCKIGKKMLIVFFVHKTFVCSMFIEQKIEFCLSFVVWFTKSSCHNKLYDMQNPSIVYIFVNSAQSFFSRSTNKL